jgi:integrase
MPASLLHLHRTDLPRLDQTIQPDEAVGRSGGKRKAFLTHLAIDEKVTAATQNNGLVLLYKRVLEQPLDETINAVRAEKKLNVSVVLTCEEVVKVIPLLDGAPQLLVKLSNDSGPRIMEAVRLHVQDLDYALKQITVRPGKGDKARITTFPASLIPSLENHWEVNSG